MFMGLIKVWGQRRNPETKANVEDAVGTGKDGEAGTNEDTEKTENAGQGSNEEQDGEKKRVNDLDQAVDTFIEAILASEVYRTYRAELERAKQNPDLKKEIDEFRCRNFELQASQDADYESLDCFEKEYEAFREQPLVADFLAAELDLCRKLQGISMRVVEALNFE